MGKEKMLNELRSRESKLLCDLEERDVDIKTLSSNQCCTLANLEYWKLACAKTSSLYTDVQSQLQQESCVMDELLAKVNDLSSSRAIEKIEYDGVASESTLSREKFLNDLNLQKTKLMEKFQVCISTMACKENKLLEVIQLKDRSLLENTATIKEKKTELGDLHTQVSQLVLENDGK